MNVFILKSGNIYTTCAAQPTEIGYNQRRAVTLITHTLILILIPLLLMILSKFCVFETDCECVAFGFCFVFVLTDKKKKKKKDWLLYGKFNPFFSSLGVLFFVRFVLFLSHSIVL